MYTVTLKSFPADKLHRLERVVQKHNGAKLEYPQRNELLHKVQAGQPQVVARYAEEHVAANVVLEYKTHGATAEMAEEGAATA
jgi:hypothetical protein